MGEWGSEKALPPSVNQSIELGQYFDGCCLLSCIPLNNNKYSKVAQSTSSFAETGGQNKNIKGAIYETGKLVQRG